MCGNNILEFSAHGIHWNIQLNVHKVTNQKCYLCTKGDLKHCSRCIFWEALFELLLRRNTQPVCDFACLC
ncbi:hypothetical protein Naga_100009g32 [Nannochloropsis gaditana]|uniref:Uncharacterized protein n=1 Tax=Nannochloropsis gaditana TaxID=72520 RepID=W7TYH0_9STRA|nr:hypothetical protein Naga_100009g32 [Nannochloropsis gaditana]